MSVSGSSGTRNSGISSHSHAAAASLSGQPPRTAVLSLFAAIELSVPLSCPLLLDSNVPVVLALTPRLQFLGRTAVCTMHMLHRDLSPSVQANTDTSACAVCHPHTPQRRRKRKQTKQTTRDTKGQTIENEQVVLAPNCMVGRNFFRHRCYQL